MSVASVWLVVVEPGRWWLAALGAIGAVFWIRRSVPVLRRSASVISSELRLDADRLVAREGAEERTIAWHEVDSVEVDEDRLVVRLKCASDASKDFVVEPLYEGVSVYALHLAIEHAWREAVERG